MNSKGLAPRKGKNREAQAGVVWELRALAQGPKEISLRVFPKQEPTGATLTSPLQTHKPRDKQDRTVHHSRTGVNP
jgi:hypothetical protein